MTLRRPLVRIDGETRQLPEDDTLPVPRALPFFLTDGSTSDIDLTTAEALPFFLADGSPSDISLTL